MPKKHTEAATTKKLGDHTERLMVKLTDAEAKERAQQLATAVQDIEREELQQASVKTQMKAKLAELQARIANLASVVNGGEELRDVVCDVWADFQRKVADTIRVDTGAIVSTRALDESELQEVLPLA